MPKHFFDFDNGTLRYVDTDGTELADVNMVRNEAVRFLATVFKDTAPDQSNCNLVVNVRDERDRVVYTTALTLQENWVAAAEDCERDSRDVTRICQSR